MQQVTISIPVNTHDITVGQFQRYVTLLQRTDLSQIESDKRKIEIFTGLPYRDVSRLSATDYHDIIEAIDLALNTEAEFQQRFKIADVEFGFVPNLDAITMEQWASLSEIDGPQGPDPMRFHEFLAVLFQPIDKTDKFGNYSVLPYVDGAFDETMKSASMAIVNGAMVFFYLLGTELLNSTRKSTQVAQVKEKRRSRFFSNGAGTPPSRKWPRTNPGTSLS